MRNRATTPLKKAKFRMSMSKHNLYNLARLSLPYTRQRTFYQQKWTAKSILRQYHGEQVREAQWQRMFSRRLRSVVPMDPAYLAKNDGSAESAGRGRGLEDAEERRKGKEARPNKDVQMTPYMNMTFAPLERRLDVAIFRALFASSARQARQFVVHGDVKVNGQVMQYSGYLLNPGDMFQVAPDRVLYAMGRKKAPVVSSLQRRIRKATASEKETLLEKVKCHNCKEKGHVLADCPKPVICRNCQEEGHIAADCPNASTSTPVDGGAQVGLKNRPCFNCNDPGHLTMECPKPLVCNKCSKEGHHTVACPTMLKKGEPFLCFNCGEEGHQADSCPQPKVCKYCHQDDHFTIRCRKERSMNQVSVPELGRTAKDVLKDLQRRAKNILSSPREDLGAKQKRNLREFAQTVRKMMSQAGRGSVLTDSLEAQFEELQYRLKIQKEAKDKSKSLGPSQQEGSESRQQHDEVGRVRGANHMSAGEQHDLFQALKMMHENPVDKNLPYHTPWMPRDYMSAFSFIPRYLEVNQNACAAVYLRHPVARPGLAEVPTPYPESVNETAFNWYLRRR